MAAEGEECEGDEGFGSVESERDPGGNRILVSALGPWGIGSDEQRSCAGFESLPMSPTGTSTVAG